MVLQVLVQILFGFSPNRYLVPGTCTLYIQLLEVKNYFSTPILNGNAKNNISIEENIILIGKILWIFSNIITTLSSIDVVYFLVFPLRIDVAK